MNWKSPANRVALLALFSFLPCAAASGNSSLVSSYELTGSFQRNGERSALRWSRPHDPVDSFDSYGGSDARTGTLRTAVFQAPAELHMFVSGFPSFPGMRIYLSDEQRGRSVDLTDRVSPGNAWKMHYWKIPQDWQGARVRLIVEDNGTAPNSWVGVTLPESGGQTLIVSILRAGLRNGLVVVYGLLFLLPGLAGCALLSRRGVVFDLKRAVCAVLVIGSFCAWCVFGLYLLGPAVGQAASLLVMGVSGILALTLRASLFPGQTALRRELTACLAAVLLAGIFSCSLGYLYTTDDGAGEVAQVRYRVGMPPDNLLPEMFAGRLYHGQSVLPTIFAYWHSSDRPPLETAIMLLEMRLFPPDKDVLTYESFGIFLQCTWIAGVWVLLRSAGLGMRHVAFAVAFCLFSYFCLLHTFYVWAKLLSTTCCLLGLSFFPFIRLVNAGRAGEWTPLDGALSGAALALGMLCHPGIAFTIVGILAVAAFNRGLPPFRTSLVAIAAMLVFLLPWQAYQKLYDPPGDNLMKAHLAGVIDFHRSLTECVVTAYRNLTFHRWALNKLANFKILFIGDHLIRLFPWDTHRVLDEFIESTFFYLFFATGLLNAGFLARLRGRGDRAVLRLAGRFLLVVAVSLVAWCIVMFDPGSTVVHQGSFATVILLFVGLALWLLESAPKLAAALLAVQFFVLFPIFVFDWPLYTRPGTIGDAPIDSVMALVALLSLAALALLFHRLCYGPFDRQLTPY